MNWMSIFNSGYFDFPTVSCLEVNISWVDSFMFVENGDESAEFCNGTLHV